MAVSLNNIGATQLKKTSGAIAMNSMHTAVYIRTWTDATTFARENPYEAANGDAPTEHNSPYNLNDFDGYIQSTCNVGTGLTATPGYGKVTISWNLPSNFNTYRPQLLAVKGYVKGTGYSGGSPGETETSTEPRTSPYTTNIEGYTNPGPTTMDFTISGLAGTWVAVCLTGLFDDSDEVFESTTEYGVDAGESYPLTGGDIGCLVFVYDTEPTINSVVQQTDPNTCSIPDDVDVNINVTMEGTSTGTLQRKTGVGGTWGNVDTNVTAGSSVLNDTVASGNTYYYRLRYNTGPSDWSNEGSFSATCNLP